MLTISAQPNKWRKQNDRPIGVFKQPNQILYRDRRGPKQILFGSPVALGQREVSNASLCKHLKRRKILIWLQTKWLQLKNAIQSKHMQVKGPSKIVQFTEDATTEFFKLKPPQADCQNTTCKIVQVIEAQTTGLERYFMESSDRKQ